MVSVEASQGARSVRQRWVTISLKATREGMGLEGGSHRIIQAEELVGYLLGAG